MRKSDIRDCLSAHLETKLEFAYTVVASLQVVPDPCLNSCTSLIPELGEDVRHFAVTRRRRLTEVWRCLWSLRSRYGPTTF